MTYAIFFGALAMSAVSLIAVMKGEPYRSVYAICLCANVATSTWMIGAYSLWATPEPAICTEPSIPHEASVWKMRYQVVKP
jgi:hypothetical protein